MPIQTSIPEARSRGFSQVERQRQKTNKPRNKGSAAKTPNKINKNNPDPTQKTKIGRLKTTAGKPKRNPGNKSRVLSLQRKPIAPKINATKRIAPKIMNQTI